MKSKLKQLIKDYELYHADLEKYETTRVELRKTYTSLQKREDKLESTEDCIIMEMLNKNIIDDEWCGDHDRVSVPHLLYALLDQLEK